MYHHCGILRLKKISSARLGSGSVDTTQGKCQKTEPQSKARVYLPIHTSSKWRWSLATTPDLRCFRSLKKKIHLVMICCLRLRLNDLRHHLIDTKSKWVVLRKKSCKEQEFFASGFCIGEWEVLTVFPLFTHFLNYEVVACLSDKKDKLLVLCRTGNTQELDVNLSLEKLRILSNLTYPPPPTPHSMPV